MTLAESKKTTKLCFAISLLKIIYIISFFYLIVFIVLNVGKNWILFIIVLFLMTKIIDITFVQPQIWQLLNNYLKIINIALKKCTKKTQSPYKVYFSWHDGLGFIERHFEKYLNYNIVYTMKELLLMCEYSQNFSYTMQNMRPDIILEDVAILIAVLGKYPLIKKSSNRAFYSRKYANFLKIVTYLYLKKYNHIKLDLNSIDFSEIFEIRENLRDSLDLKYFILNRFNEHLIKIK